MTGINSVMGAMCHAVRTVGYPKKRERRLELLLKHYLKSNGSEWTLQRFKSFQACKLQQMSSSSNTVKDWKWISHTRSSKRPLGPILRDVWSLKDKKFFSVTGAIIESVSYTEPQPFQVVDWYKTQSQSAIGARYDVPETIRAAVVKTAHKFVPVWENIARRNFNNTVNQSPFSPLDMNTVSYPGVAGHETISYTYEMRGGKPTGRRVFNTASVYRAYDESLKLFPSCFSQKLRQDTDLFRTLMLSNNSIYHDVLDYRANLRFIGKELKAATTENIRGNRSHFGDTFHYDLQSRLPLTLVPKSQRSLTDYEKTHYVDKSDSFRQIKLPVVGEINFLPKPGAKLRTVASPNKRIQHELNPLGEAIQDSVYQDPNIGPSIFVKDQDLGKTAIMNELRSGNTLSSVDLSSATDNMDFQRSLVISGFYTWASENKESIEHGHEIMSRSSELAVSSISTSGGEGTYLPSLSDDDLLDLCHARLYEDMGFFNSVRRGIWKVNLPEGEDQGIIPRYTRFRRGQPLGTRPSFPLLTLTNAAAAEIGHLIAADGEASSSNPTRPYHAIVGDDIVIDRDSYRGYSQVLTFLGCPVNHDKTVNSNKVAEFCGSIITRNDVFQKKPRVTEDNVENALRFGYTEKTSWLKPYVADANYSYIIGKDNFHNLPLGDKLSVPDLLNRPDNPRRSDIVRVRELRDNIKSLTQPRNDSFESVSVLLRTLGISPEDYSRRPESHLHEVRTPVSATSYDHKIGRSTAEKKTTFQGLKSAAEVGQQVKELSKTGSTIVPVQSPEGNHVADVLMGSVNNENDSDPIVFRRRHKSDSEQQRGLITANGSSDLTASSRLQQKEAKDDEIRKRLLTSSARGRILLHVESWDDMGITEQMVLDDPKLDVSERKYLLKRYRMRQAAIERRIEQNTLYSSSPTYPKASKHINMPRTSYGVESTRNREMNDGPEL